jgi:acetylornithine deacetylase/succinyl-diaminopimelate desuccinylase-like protein
MSDLGDTATELLAQLVRFDTVSPPGNERAAQEHIARRLADAGFEVELLGRTPQRPNVVARLRGRSDGPTLGLLSHIDTVYATPADWRRDPWSGDIDDDGFLWGRGALDMKSQTAAEVAAALSLAAEGWRPAAGDLLIVVTVDEETGGADGARWLCETQTDRVRCDYLLNEGAGAVMEFDGRRHVGVSVAEKGVFRLQVVVDGAAGHASYPRLGDNALLKVGPLLDAMRDRQPGFDLTDAPRALLEALGLEPGDPAAAVAALRERAPALAPLIEPTLGVTLAPTMAHASEKINVLPSVATIGIDCRVPPGLGHEVAQRRVTEVLGDGGYRLIWGEDELQGNGSPLESPLMDAIREWIAVHDPQTGVTPTIMPAFTDSHAWRATFPEIVAYGFFPHKHMTLHDVASLMHAADERIDLRDLRHAAAFFRDTARRLLA